MLLAPLAACGRPAVPWGSDVPTRRASADEAALEADLLARVNAFRRAERLPEVRLDERLSTIARAHSADMASGEYLEHESPDKGALAERLDRAGFAWEEARENVGRVASVESAHRGFLASPGHRANLLLPGATDAGIGIVRRGGTIYVTEILVRVAADVAPSDLEADLWVRTSRATGRHGRLDRLADRLAALVPVDLSSAGMADLAEAVRREEEGAVEIVAQVAGGSGTIDPPAGSAGRPLGIGVARDHEPDGRPVYKVLFLIGR